jgi:hypothetical protein
MVIATVYFTEKGHVYPGKQLTHLDVSVGFFKSTLC